MAKVGWEYMAPPATLLEMGDRRVFLAHRIVLPRGGALTPEKYG